MGCIWNVWNADSFKVDSEENNIEGRNFTPAFTLSNYDFLHQMVDSPFIDNHLMHCSNK